MYFPTLLLPFLSICKVAAKLNISMCISITDDKKSYDTDVNSLFTMFENPLKKRCICWICLEESNFDAAWIHHECGCNLQVHKLCYLHWLYSINKDYILKNLVTKNLSLVTEDDLKLAMCYLIDGHRDFHREVSFSEFFNNLPFMKTKSNESITSSMNIMSILGINYSISFRIVRTPMTLPVEYAECPQCRKHIVDHQITFTRPSFCLAVIHWIKIAVRNTILTSTLVFSTLNVGKLWFKIGIWQLRCIFPENVLRVILDTSTTKALDVYGETMNGLISVPPLTRFLVFGYPLYLMGARSSYPSLNRFRWLYSLVLSVRAGHYDPKASNVLSKTLTCCNLSMLLHSVLIKPFLSRYYEYLVKDARPYFHPVDKELDFFPSRDYDNIIIKTSWYDVVFESMVWPVLGSILGGKIFDAVTWIQRELGFNWSPSCSPNDCRMVFNFVGCGVTAAARQLLNMWTTHMRVKELKKLQESIDDNYMQ